MKNVFLAGVALLALTGAAQAGNWTIDYAHSSLTFTGNESGHTFTGGFRTFTAQIALDPDHPEGGKIDVAVDIASAYAGSSDRDAMLPQADWFDTGKFPQAHFVTTAIHKTAAGTYQADATVTIKGVSRPVTLPFTLTHDRDHWRAQGHVTLMRNDFGVGLGEFANENYVKNPVDVVVDLAAAPTSPP